MRNFIFNEGDIIVKGVTTECTTLFCNLTNLLSDDDISLLVPITQVSCGCPASPHFVDIQPSIPNDTHENRSRFQRAYQAADNNQRRYRGKEDYRDH